MKRGSPEYWAAIRPEVRWTAIDSNGGEWGYSNKPFTESMVEEWLWKMPGGCSYHNLSCLNVEDRDPVGWKNSLLERPNRWQVPDARTPVDAKVWAKRGPTSEWIRCYYAFGRTVFCDGRTSWSVEGQGGFVAYCIVLADPDDPERQPSDDYVPR